MELGIAGRAALVTGASKGIGFAIARALLAEGARVAITSRSRERVEAAAAELGAVPFVHESGDLDAIPALLDQVQRELGPLEIVVVNTGGPPPGEPLGFSREQWEAAYRDLVLFAVALVEAVLPGMRERGWGRVVNVGSTSVREPIEGLVLSNAHRSAAVAAFKTVAREVGADGVTLNTLLTGRIKTERTLDMSASIEEAEAEARELVPVGRLGTPEEFAAVATFLCSEQASYVTGATVPVDGGLLRGV
jgi:3-oxoacyl-[acyl-carrier protein] reductase